MGFNKTSEAGENLFAPSIFLFGCNLRCSYCMNGRLVVVKKTDYERPVKTVDIEVVKSYVMESGSKWVMISGGEPTYTPIAKLHNLIDEIKSWGCKVGISTNGTRPDILNEILPKINYVALDIKSNSPFVYATLDVKNHEKSFSNLLESKLAIRESKLARSDFSYEIRTTLYPKFVNKNSIDVIGSMLYEDDTWVLQQFRHARDMLGEDEAVKITPYTDEDLKDFQEQALKYVKKVIIRYV